MWLFLWWKRSAISKATLCSTSTRIDSPVSALHYTPFRYSINPTIVLWYGTWMRMRKGFRGDHDQIISTVKKSIFSFLFFFLSSQLLVKFLSCLFVTIVSITFGMIICSKSGDALVFNVLLTGGKCFNIHQSLFYHWLHNYSMIYLPFVLQCTVTFDKSVTLHTLIGWFHHVLNSQQWK